MPRSQSNDWDYDDVDSIYFGLLNSVMGDRPKQKAADTITKPTARSNPKAKSLGKGRIQKQQSERTAATADISSSFCSTTERTHPTTEGESSSNSTGDLLVITPASSPPKKTPKKHRTDLTRAEGNTNTNSEDECEGKISKKKLIASSRRSTPLFPDVPTVIYGKSLRKSQKMQLDDFYSDCGEEAAVIPSQQALEDAYEQTRRQNRPSQGELAQRYADLQQPEVAQELQVGGLSSPEEKWESNFGAPSSPGRRRRNGRATKQAAGQRRLARRSAAANRLLNKSSSMNSDSQKDVVQQRALELGIDDDIESTHSRSVISRTSSRILLRRSNSRRYDDSVGNDVAGFMKQDVVVDNHQQDKDGGVEIIRLDNAPLNTKQKRKHVFWRFFAAGWKAVTFQWGTSGGGYNDQEEQEVESDDDGAYYSRNERRVRQQGSSRAVGYPRRGSF